MSEKKQRKSFRQLYCEFSGHPPEEFEKRVLLSCLFWHAGIVGRVFWLIDRRYFQEDVDLLGFLAVTQDYEEFKREVANHRFENPPKGILRNLFRIRLSGRRLLKLAAELFPEEEVPSPRQADDTTQILKR